jgi:ribonucleoside-diphosphate reductase alpha chain
MAASIQDFAPVSTPPPAFPNAFQVIRRNGTLSDFDASKISVAITKAFLAVEGTAAADSRRIHDSVAALTTQIVETLTRRADASRPIHIEDIQDQVELALMRSGEHKIARAYVLYRDERAQARRKQEAPAPTHPQLNVRLKNKTTEPLDELALHEVVATACATSKASPPKPLWPKSAAIFTTASSSTS